MGSFGRLAELRAVWRMGLPVWPSQSEGIWPHLRQPEVRGIDPDFSLPEFGTHGPPRLPRWLVSKGNFAEDFGGVSTAVGMMTSTSSSNFTE
ncbi:unnamed protein product [Toxocara canis]|uniref:Secreted protein n=1 Tax=Toxocara canis TaxID=6265 RepID=A0A183ULZ0_TOXCA|nr:unnamed protein product [Toxocara canis]